MADRPVPPWQEQEEMVWSDARRQWAELLAGPPPSPQVRALRDAWRQGYRQAIEDLQARAAELRKAVDEGRAPLGVATRALVYDGCAGYLEAQIAIGEETRP